MGKWVHRIIEKDLSSMTGVCSYCGPVRLRNKGNARYGCGEASRVVDRRRNKGGNLITVDEYNRLLQSQEGKCGICQMLSTTTLCVDHDHVTGHVRGLLCQRCNSGIAFLGDSLEGIEMAKKYLESAS